MLKIIEFTRTDDDKWMYQLRYKQFKSHQEFIEWTKKELEASKCDNYHRNYYIIENKKLQKILYIHEGQYNTL